MTAEPAAPPSTIGPTPRQQVPLGAVPPERLFAVTRRPRKRPPRATGSILRDISLRTLPVSTGAPAGAPPASQQSHTASAAPEHSPTFKPSPGPKARPARGGRRSGTTAGGSLFRPVGDAVGVRSAPRVVGVRSTGMGHRGTAGRGPRPGRDSRLRARPGRSRRADRPGTTTGRRPSCRDRAGRSLRPGARAPGHGRPGNCPTPADPRRRRAQDRGSRAAAAAGGSCRTRADRAG